MKGPVENLLSEIAEMVAKELDDHLQDVRQMLPQLDVDEAEYKRLLLSEVVNDVVIEAQFAFPPHKSYSPDEVKTKALDVFRRKFERDKMLYSEQP